MTDKESVKNCLNKLGIPYAEGSDYIRIVPDGKKVIYVGVALISFNFTLEGKFLRLDAEE